MQPYGVRGEIEMSLNEDYACFLIAASNIYATQYATACSKAESKFEQDLLKLLAKASNSGVALQDIVVIASTAIAVMLTKQDAITSAKRPPMASPNANVVALRPRAS
jgi:hypothetical protein